MEQSEQVILKNFWRRLLAYLVDCVLIFVVLAAGMAFLGQGLASGQISINWIGVGVTALVLCYEMFLIKIYGATLGKLIMKIKVVDLGLNPLGWGRALARAVSRFFHMFVFGLLGQSVFGGYVEQNLKYLQDPLQTASHGLLNVSMALIFFWVLMLIINNAGYYFYYFTKNKQALHDLMAGTFVIRR